MSKSNEGDQHGIFYESFFSEEARTSGRVVLITGGVDPIGEAFVRRFAEAGDKVTFTSDKNDVRAKEIAADLEIYGVQALPYDQFAPNGCEELLENLTEPVEVLIHNAGFDTRMKDSVESAHDQTVMRGPVEPALLQIMTNVNVVNPTTLTRSLLTSMQQRNYGKIIFIGRSGEGYIDHPLNRPGYRDTHMMNRASLIAFTSDLGDNLRNGMVDPFMVYQGILPGNSNYRILDVAREVANLCYLLTSTNAGRLLKGSVIDVSLGLQAIPKK